MSICRILFLLHLSLSFSPLSLFFCPRRLSGDVDRSAAHSGMTSFNATGRKPLPVGSAHCGSQSTLQVVSQQQDQLPPPGTPRKLSNTSVTSFGSFASSYQDYCRKLSNSSMSSGLAGSSTMALPDEPASPLCFTTDRSTHQFLSMVDSESTAATAGYGPNGAATDRTGTRASSMRKMSDPHEYGRSGRTHGAAAGGAATCGKMAPLLFEVDRSGGIRRLTASALEHYRPYLSRCVSRVPNIVFAALKYSAISL
jgi:hypothetical protein